MIGSNIRILQINLNKNQTATENTLQLAIELHVDLIIVQEPWILNKDLCPSGDYATTRSVTHNGFYQILPKHYPYVRPRTIVYVAKTFTPTVSLSQYSPVDGDFQDIQITEDNSTMQLINVYNEKCRAGGHQKTFQRCLKNHPISLHSLIVGDFNLHHHRWDPVMDGNASDEA